MNKPKIAFVVQRNGKEVNGGAEYHCFLIAKLIKDIFDVEILTTCALDYMTWDNYYEEGIEIVEEVVTRRFKVDTPRNVKDFNIFSNKVLPDAKSTSLNDAEKWMNLQGPLSSELLKYIHENKNNYNNFIFFTYLYASTYFGLQLVAEKAILVPTLHDEPPVYLPIWDKWFSLPKYLIYNTIEEETFIKSRFQDINFKGETIGVGVDILNNYSSINFRQKYDIYSPYILYVGRIDESKGCNHLFEYFIKFKQENNIQLKLVLAGKSVIEIPQHKDIIHLGFIDDQTKFDAIDGCEFLVNSSPFESLSMVLLEAWSLNKPVLVNAKAEVMVGQCKRSQGGLWYNNYEEFTTNTLYLIKNSFKFKNMKQFIDDNYSWDIIREKYLKVIDASL